MYNYGARHIFMVIAIVILIMSPILLLPMPTFIASNMHGLQGWVVYVPGKAYLLYGFGFLFLFGSAFILSILDLSKVAKIISISILLISVAFFASAAQNYTLFANDSIAFRESIWTDRQSYTWDELEIVKFDLSAGLPKYEFRFKDGKEIALPENGYIRVFRSGIEGKLKEHRVEFVKRYY
ncbi:hypothetical protein QTL97_15220 [Sporosarcina thermotolerans]|uniref:Uncharacterized protein n=1 Tax=Sporosarcina thermotolerans TaxID=633404 RepID=A0AAW9ACG8_9BACL|nr:hypothetical protein [Sporosarcina thermotolerans]MDW0118283.1 hypothetical protein [Sporosarcina thermotolerans]WHT48594.1 hypothetical protein QNH10_01805 [Sporosarcina thermotolerans]